MAQTNYTPISLYYSTTASAVPTAANLVQGELAINTNDGKLYYEDSSGVVQTLASKAGALGDVVGPASATDNALARFDLTTGKLIQNSVGILSDAGILTGLTGLTSSGSITLSSLTSGRVTFAGASGLLTDSANLTFDGATLTTSNGSGAAGLIVNSSANTPYLRFDQSNAAKFTIGESSIVGGGAGFYDFYAVASVGQRFWTGATQRMTILSTGEVGIGTSSPNAKLQVTSSAFPVLKVADAIGGGALALGDEGTNNNYVGIWRGTANSISGGGFLNVQGNGIAFMSSDNVFGSGTERMRIDSSGNVGIGTTSPSSFTTFSPKLVVGSGSGGQRITIYSGTAGEGDLIFADGTTGNEQYRGTVRYDHADDAMKFYTNGGINAMIINSAQGVQVTNTVGVGAATPSTSGAGITFPATQSASSNANTLDDYEEGTWTPTIAGDGTEFVGASYTTRAGKYVKVGDVVWVSFDIDVSLAGTLINNASVGGLPFAIPNSANLSNGGGGINYVNGIQQNYVYQSCYPQNNSSFLFITGRTAASTGSITLASSAFYANSMRLAGFAWYRTTV